MTAPVCPINRSQVPPGSAHVTQPGIPVATDMDSLLKSVNAMIDIVRGLTMSLTVNNTYLPRQPPVVNYMAAPYPEWEQINVNTSPGLVYYKTAAGPDPRQRAYISRIKSIEYRNNSLDTDRSFFWGYKRPLDAPPGSAGGNGLVAPFEEDMFERVVNVHWGKKVYLYIYASAGNSRGGKAGPNPIEGVPDPYVNIGLSTGGVIELERFEDPENNKRNDGFGGCLTYEPKQTAFKKFGPTYIVDNLLWADPIDGPRGKTAQESYDYIVKKHKFSAFIQLRSSIGGTSCAPQPTQYPVGSISSWNWLGQHREATYYTQLSTVPVNYYSNSGVSIEALYEVPVIDNVLYVEVGGIIPNGKDPRQSGGGIIEVAVFSTHPGVMTGLHNVRSLNEYGSSNGIDFEDMLVDPDHMRRLKVSAKNQQGWSISISHDTRPESTQIDNYGQSYSPYKVAFTPKGGTTIPTPQPPMRIGYVVQAG
jgi:hypothetical protein